MKNIFDFLKQIICDKKPWSSFSDKDKELFNIYMINRFLSQNPNYIEVVNYVAGLNLSDKEKVYKIYCDFIPYNKNTFSRYIKSSNKSKPKEVIEKISLFYECSFEEAEEYSSILDKEGIVDILQKVGTDEKISKKLIKEFK